MFANLLAQFASPGQRIDAVHTHFAGRTSSDGLRVVLTTATIAILLCGVLLLLNRVQRAKARRQEHQDALRRRELTARQQPGLQLPATSTGHRPQ